MEGINHKQENIKILVYFLITWAKIYAYNLSI